MTPVFRYDRLPTRGFPARVLLRTALTLSGTIETSIPTSAFAKSVERCYAPPTRVDAPVGPRAS